MVGNVGQALYKSENLQEAVLRMQSEAERRDCKAHHLANGLLDAAREVNDSAGARFWRDVWNHLMALEYPGLKTERAKQRPSGPGHRPFATARIGVKSGFPVSCYLGDMTSDRALSELKEGNQRFRENRVLQLRRDLARVRETAENPRPFATILTCADSRITPEIIFDQGIGDLFSVRVAGNVANGDEIASIQYAVEQLHTPLCVVMGHSGCLAVQVVMSGNHLPLDLDQLFRQIKTAVANTRRANPRISGRELMQGAVRENVCLSLNTLRHALRGLIEQEKVRIVGAEYQVDCGEVVWID
jgi:carbonic anhydrase